MVQLRITFPTQLATYVFRKACMLLRFSNLGCLCINFVLKISSQSMAMSPFLIPIVFFIPFISQMGLPEVSLLYCLFENRISSWIYLLISLCFCFLIHLFLPVSLMFFFSLSFPIGAVFILFFFKRSQNECWLILFLSPFLIIKAFKAMRTVPAVSHRFGYVAFWFQCFSKYLSVDSLFLS